MDALKDNKVVTNINALLTIEGYDTIINDEYFCIKYNIGENANRWFAIHCAYFDDMEIITKGKKLQGIDKTNFIKDDILKAYNKWVSKEKQRFYDITYIKNKRGKTDEEKPT